MGGGRPHASSGRPLIEARRLTVGYDTDQGAVLAVDDVSFTVDRGERLVLLGPSGCGKSTILKTVAGFLRPTSGEILVDGRPVTRPGPDRLVVFQEFDQLLPWKSTLDNVAFPLRAAWGKSRADALELAAAALAKVGLSHALDAYPHTLSGGMKQRAAIARALAASPDVLLMDEPFAALDALTRSTLQHDLLRLADELNFTLLFVTHAIDEAILIGTQLHLLSAHPGRTISTHDTSRIGQEDVGSAQFQELVTDIRRDLFERTAEAAA